MTNMETLFIGYPPCSTCKKAYKALQDLGIEATYRNIKEDNPTKEEIQSWIDRGVELKKLFNTSGMLYRELNVKEKRETYTEEQLIEMLRISNAAAYLVTTKKGAIRSMPNPDEVEKIVKSK